MIKQEIFEYKQPELADIIDLIDDVDDNKSQLRELFEHSGTLIINRPHVLEGRFLEKVVEFLMKYHKEFRGVFEDEFLAKAVVKILQDFSDERRQEIRESVVETESSIDRVSYIDLLLMEGVTPKSFINSYTSFYKNLYEGKKKAKKSDVRDFKNFIQTIVIGLGFANRIDDAKITTPIGLVIQNINDRLNADDGNDPILTEIYKSMTDPNLTTGRFEVEQEALEIMKETPTDPVAITSYTESINETISSEFTTDPDIAGDGIQKMHLLISLEKLVAQSQEFYFATWLNLSNNEIRACYKNYEMSLKALEVCWDWSKWQIREDFDIRNLAFVYQEALTGFNRCLKDIVLNKSSKNSTDIKNDNFTPVYVGVSLSTFENLEDTEHEASRLDITLMEIDESIPKTTLSYFEGKIVPIRSNFSGIPEDPSQWSFEYEDDGVTCSSKDLATADIDRREFAKLLQSDVNKRR